ncbi:fibrinogen-like protein 1 [Plakobranchus ocellatus]|uniref:Fibrinogen-like protein 1 n=1 Tax=Plakobranchus ocellatus TaxID=259542 RepID=A0AAV4BR34_9GAST|nr:fibrinogen-like protein 1 [Plakobranchus ocellatus]
MDRNRFYLIFLALNWICCGLGQELSLDRDVDIEPGQKPLCGVLTCDVTTVVDTQDVCQDDLKVSFKVVSSLSIFKRYPNKGKRIRVVTLTENSPIFRGVANRWATIGFLNEAGATVKLNLAKERDCGSEFTCEVRGTDLTGKEAVSSTTLLPQSLQGGGQALGGSLMPAISFQLLSLVQQLHTKLSILSQSMDGWEDSYVALDNSVQDKISSMERQMEYKIDSLENKLDTSVNRIEDEFDNTISDKFNALFLKLSGGCGPIDWTGQEAHIGMEDGAGILGNLTSLGERMEDQQKEVFESMNLHYHKMDRVLNETAELLSSIQSDVKQTEKCRLDTEAVVSNITEMVASLKLQHVWRDAVKDALQLSIDEVLETVSDVRENISAAQEQFPLRLHIDIKKDGVKPQSCKKGLVAVKTQSGFPYPVISPGSDGSVSFPHLCDTVTDGGGWVVIQRRSTGNVNFDLLWDYYKNGFGSFDDDFWLGNENIHALTSVGTWELLVNITYKGKDYYARYDRFSIGSEAEKYKLDLGTYSGIAGNAMAVHNNMKFSTRDADNDNYSKSCAEKSTGGWWFNRCDEANLNGRWGEWNDEGIEWNTIDGYDKCMSFSEMKVRQIQ